MSEQILDRSLQKRLLSELADFYPERVSLESLIESFPGESAEKNLHYLIEHGLVDAQILAMANGTTKLGHPRINHRGMDFLADDGGLAAVLGTVTVKLHEDSIRALLEARVEELDEDQGTKDQVRAAIRSAPANALRQVSEYAIQKGLENLPNAASLLQALSGSP